MQVQRVPSTCEVQQLVGGENTGASEPVLHLTGAVAIQLRLIVTMAEQEPSATRSSDFVFFISREVLNLEFHGRFPNFKLWQLTRKRC